jgi:hypothetical protein
MKLQSVTKQKTADLIFTAEEGEIMHVAELDWIEFLVSCLLKCIILCKTQNIFLPKANVKYSFRLRFSIRGNLYLQGLWTQWCRTC